METGLLNQGDREGIGVLPALIVDGHTEINALSWNKPTFKQEQLYKILSTFLNELNLGHPTPG